MELGDRGEQAKAAAVHPQEMLHRTHIDGVTLATALSHRVMRRCDGSSVDSARFPDSVDYCGAVQIWENGCQLPNHLSDTQDARCMDIGLDSDCDWLPREIVHKPAPAKTSFPTPLLETI